MIEGYVIFDFSSFSNDHTYRVVNHEATTDLRTRMNIYAGKKPPDIPHEPR